MGGLRSGQHLEPFVQRTKEQQRCAAAAAAADTFWCPCDAVVERLFREGTFSGLRWTLRQIVVGEHPPPPTFVCHLLPH